jgi:asparagine synthase (glutamine-hydrolysing)
MALMLAEAGDWPRVYGLLRNVWDSPRLRRLLYGPRLLDQSLPNAFDELAARWPDVSDPVAAVARVEWQGKMVNDLLWQEDRVSMAHGLEVRVPFVDRQLAARLARLDRHTMMPAGRRKGLLRDSVATLLPSEILVRPKSGFQVQAGRFWQQLEPLAETCLSDTEVRRHGLFNPEFVRRMRRAPARTGLRWHFFLLYLMLGTHLWLRRFQPNA